PVFRRGAEQNANKISATSGKRRIPLPRRNIMNLWPNTIGASTMPTSITLLARNPATKPIRAVYILPMDRPEIYSVSFQPTSRQWKYEDILKKNIYSRSQVDSLILYWFLNAIINE